MQKTRHDADDPHGGQPVLIGGDNLGQARAAMILVHGRGASARSILSLGTDLGRDSLALLAPQAKASTWYPHSFLAPIEQNEPHLSSALNRLARLVDRVEASGISAQQLFLIGFSQGACLALEFAARNARRYGGIAGLTGGLIGPDITGRQYPGSFEGTPVYLASSDPDPHIPTERVDETASIFEEMGADVTKQFFQGMAHAINDEELDVVADMLDAEVR